jgi:ABC-2 type transport system permease protein
LRGFATHQPVTGVIETVRALLLDQPLGASPLRALAWCLGIIAASVAVAGVLFRLRTR